MTRLGKYNFVKSNSINRIGLALDLCVIPTHLMGRLAYYLINLDCFVQCLWNKKGQCKYTRILIIFFIAIND